MYYILVICSGSIFIFFFGMEIKVISPIFIVFEHKPFQKGDELEDDSQNSRNILYNYPSKSTQEIVQGLISLVISLSTYSNLSLDGNRLDYISLHDKKLAISYFDKTDNSQIVFILISYQNIEEQSLKNALNDLMSGLFFIFGPEGLEKTQQLIDFFVADGSRLINMIMPNLETEEESKIAFAFPAIPFAEMHESILPTSLTELYLMSSDPRIWGICCFVDSHLLMSMSPISLVRLFLYMTPDSPQDTVYLTRKDREAILNENNIKPEIPDQDIIPATMLKFDHGTVVFYVLTSPLAQGGLLLNIVDTLQKTMPHILKVTDRKTKFPDNTMMYDKKMMLLKKGVTLPNDKTTSFMHTLFNEKRPANDALLRDAEKLLIGYNTYDVENFSIVDCNCQQKIEEVYDKAKLQSPQIHRFLQNIKY